jgi:DNA transformation protein
MKKSVATSSQLNEFVDMLSDVGEVATKRFFGGMALLYGGTQFAFYIKDGLYFRVDDGNRSAFVEAGSRPFEYRQSSGKTIVVKAFYAVPEAALDDRREMCRLARGAIEAGLRIDRAKDARGR